MKLSETDIVHHIRTFSELLDSRFSIPGTKIRFGLDAIIGLIPGFGDSIGGLLSALIILQSARLGVSRIVLVRMAINVIIEVIIGAVPFIGDIFDVAWKANIRNSNLLEKYISTKSRKAPQAVVHILEAAGLLLLVVLASVLFGAAGILLLVWGIMR